MVLEKGEWLPVGGGVKRLGGRSTRRLECVSRAGSHCTPASERWLHSGSVCENQGSSALTDRVHSLEVSFELLVWIIAGTTFYPV